MSNPPDMTTDTLGEALVRNAVLDEAGLSRAGALAKSADIGLDRAVLRLGLAEEEPLLRVLAEVLDLPFVEEAGRLEVSGPVAAQLGLPYLRRNALAPVAQDGPEVVMLTARPADRQLQDEIAFQLEAEVRMMVAPERAILKALDTLEQGPRPGGLSDEQAKQDRRAFDSARMDGPVIAFVSKMLSEAVAQGASDLHFAMSDQGLDLRFRLNGVLVRQPVAAPVGASAVFARLKVMAGMNVAERRRPQDGRITSVIAGRIVDFRVSAMPTQLGESVVVRVLDPRALRLGWEHLGFDAGTEAALRRLIELPSGLFLVTGPTGSGKTTTLYTALNHLRSERRKIITIEDPVEYQLPDVDQVQVRDDQGLGFSDALRSVLRQDPNVIMVGEIRDAETAQIACRAALVGRMVLSTLHTSSAGGAMARMLDLGVEEFILRDVLRGVLGQELLTVHCEPCNGHGCGQCDGTGTIGRRLKAELLQF